MLAAAASSAIVGIDAIDVIVEVHVANGLPQWTLVGLAATAVKESRDRVSAALGNSGFTVPPRRITVSLSPGDLPKAGTAFDLPIALGVLAASGQLPVERLAALRAVGELGLDGTLRPVRGVLAVARRAAARDELLVVPPDNAAEAAHVHGVRLLLPQTLAELVGWLREGPPVPRGAVPAARRRRRPVGVGPPACGGHRHRPLRRDRSAAGRARPRDCRRRRAQSAAHRPARRRQDHAGAPPARHPAAAGRRRRARGARRAFGGRPARRARRRRRTVPSGRRITPSPQPDSWAVVPFRAPER